VDPPRSDPRPVLVQADRHPLRRRPAVLEPPGVDDGSAVLTVTAPLDAAPWRASLLPEPAVDPGASAAIAASASPEVARIGPVQALAAPSSPDRPPASDVAGTAVATAPLPAAAPLRVALHLAPSLPQTAIYDAQAAVTEAGFDLAGTSLARFGVARSEVRFFHGPTLRARPGSPTTSAPRRATSRHTDPRRPPARSRSGSPRRARAC
jgi:hypothetical protein